jgi:hypothetical protein
LVGERLSARIPLYEIDPGIRAIPSVESYSIKVEHRVLRLPRARALIGPMHPHEGYTMRQRTTFGVSLLLNLIVTAPGGAADKLSPEDLEARLAAKPQGEAATALAQEIRAWFGKDRSGGY